jgi:hypothetical protein
MMISIIGMENAGANGSGVSNLHLLGHYGDITRPSTAQEPNSGTEQVRIKRY